MSTNQYNFSLLFLLCALIFSACSGDKQKEKEQTEIPKTEKNRLSESRNIAPPVSPASAAMLVINPQNATPHTTLHLSAQNIDLAHARIQWLRNGLPVQDADKTQFRALMSRKGDIIQAKAIVGGKGILSNPVTLKNSNPEISRIKILPEVFKPGDTLYVDASGTDSDKDKVTFVFQWSKNNEPAGSGKGITAEIKRGDKIVVRVTPYDGEAYGQSVTLSREVKNMPPAIVENKEFQFDGMVYSHQVVATDADGDKLTYSLDTAPEGMTIDPSTGLITWNVPADFTEDALFTVSVSDGNGGVASHQMTFTVETPPAS
jgi:hypothetical protein